VSDARELVSANTRVFVDVCVFRRLTRGVLRVGAGVFERARRALGVMPKNEQKASPRMDLKVGNTRVTGFFCAGSVTRNALFIQPNVDGCALAEAARVPSAHPLKLD
jgi:hypothetical protein